MLSISRWHALHMFVESFQGQYKDGTNGTREFRTIFASFLILRILILFLLLNHHHLPTHTHQKYKVTLSMCYMYVCYDKTI